VKILLPISLDQWRSPIASLLRAVASANPMHEFDSFSNPATDEDYVRGETFWGQDHIHKISPWQAARRRYDLVHTACLNPRNLSAAFYSKAIGSGKTQFLTTLNLEFDSSMPKRDWTCYQSALKFCDHYVAVSDVVSLRIKEDAPDRFRGVIPNGYDDEFFDPMKEIPFYSNLHNELNGYVLWISALEPRKHPEFLIKLARSQPHMTFVAAGWEHPYYADRYLPEILSVRNIIWVGHVEQKCLRSLLAHARVMIFPSEREGLPLSVIEAMGMGLPVIAQPKSSLPELITHDFCGRLVSIDSFNSIKEWSNAIEFYLNRSDEDRESQKAILSQCARQFYSWKSIGSAYDHLYRRILSNPD
jgi:glycosyltransferase involved in cell wall biosynthesis